MRSFRVAVATAAVFLSGVPMAGAGQVVPGAPVTDWQAAQSEYRLAVLREYSALIGAWHAALNDADAGAAAAAYTDSATLLVSGHDVVRGREAIAAFFGGFARTVAEIRTGLADFLASDRLAYATGPVIVTFRQESPLSVRSVAGQHVTILLREGKRWRIYSQVLKYDVGSAGGS